MARSEFTVRYPDSRWTDSAARAMLSERVPIMVDGEEVARATVVDARVVEDGAALAVTVEAPRLLIESIGEVAIVSVEPGVGGVCATQPSHLSDRQYRLLRRAVRCAQEGRPCRMEDGNEHRTARSLVRRGLAKWEPPGTRSSLVPTDAGIQVSADAGEESLLSRIGLLLREAVVSTALSHRSDCDCLMCRAAHGDEAAWVVLGDTMAASDEGREAKR